VAEYAGMLARAFGQNRSGFVISMRDCVLKRFLVRGYFSANEIWGGLRGMFGEPTALLGSMDYDAYWQLKRPSAVQPRFQIIAAYMERGDAVLDVGCGDGTMLAYMTQVKQIHGLGIDISTVAVESARKRGVEARVESLAELHRLTPASSFDHVVISEVLEHVADPEVFVRHAWQLSRNTLWLTFPNIAYFPHRLRLLAGRFPVQWVSFPGEHLRFWSVLDFRHWLRELGLPEPRFYPSNGVTLFTLHRLWPNLLANQIIVRVDKPLKHE
jgi:methionine biosynthesis protein MetW